MFGEFESSEELPGGSSRFVVEANSLVVSQQKLSGDAPRADARFVTFKRSREFGAVRVWSHR
jgi:hypothetical protein